MDRIFIVEDEWIVALELQERIQDLGYEFAGTTDTGISAIDMILETKPDLVLMDINIKGEMDGIEASRRILEKYNVPIIYISAYSDKATLERAKITTPYGYIIKPVEERDLHISIEISLTKFRIEKKLKESEKNLSITLQSIGDGVIATDQYSQITRMNRTAEKMCGWTLAEALGLPLNRVFNIISAITRQPLESPVEEVLKTGEIVELANHAILISRDGTERHISDSAAPIHDDSYEIKGVVLVFSDVTEAYINKERLQQSEKLYREVIENATDFIYTTDQNGKFIHANASALKLTGYTKEEIEERNFFDLVASEYRNKIKAHYYRQFLENTPSTYAEVPVIRKNGELCWFGQNVTLVKRDDNVTGFQVIARDISDRKKAEDALRKSEEMLRLIIDIIPDRIFVKDTEGKFITNNRAHLKALVAKSQEDALGKTDFDFHSEEKSQLYQNQDRDVLETQQPIMDYLQHEFGEDGSDTWLLVSKLPFRTSDGEIIGIVGISRDITSQKAAEDTIRESERRFQTLANVSPVGIFSTDATGYTTYVNPRWCEISGLSVEEAMGDGWLSAVHEEDKARLNQEWYSAALEARASRADYRFKKRDGSIAWVMGHAVPEFDENNQIIGYVGTITDITNRKMIEDALRESENIFNQFMMHSPIYIFFKDHNGRPIRLSNNFEQLIGLPIDQMIGKTMFELFPSDFARSIVEDDLKVLREGIQVNIEESLNGRHFTTIKFPIQHDGKPPLLAGYSIDITERKNSELEIQRLANALRSINECVSITDLDNRLTFVNESFMQTYGYFEEELIGRGIQLIASEQIPAGLPAEIREATMNGGWQGELVNKKKDGTEFPIHLSTKAIYDKDNNPIAMIGVATDITLRKQYEAEIIKLNQAVIQSPASIIITDIDGRIEYLNPKVSETTGYSREELIGNKPSIFSSHEFSKENYRLLWETILAGKEWRGEFHNRKKNGEFFWEYSSISPIKNRDGIITNFMAIKEDITERKNLELGLIEAKEKAEAASELKDAFIANISHEIRTPLNGILGMSSIIKDVFSDHITSQEEQYFTAIERSSKRIIRTVDMILNFSRLQVGDFKSSTRIISLDNLLNEIYLEFAIAAKQKGLTLTYEKSIERTEIKSDSYCLTQVLSNLLDNALKYTNEGSIKIILYRDNKANLKIDVEDTGIGISESYMNELFQPYSQEEVGYTRTYEGVGLGLSLVKNFLKLINAEISVKSQKGVGTTFTINLGNLETEQYFVTEAESNEDSQFEAYQKVSRTEKSAVLVIEDEKINQMFLSIKLKNSFDVQIVENASKALEALEGKRFDVILMDISLKGGLNGIELTQILKASSEFKNIPIIAVTGHAFTHDKDKCLQAGCDDYISKPFRIEELEKKIYQLVVLK